MGGDDPEDWDREPWKRFSKPTSKPVFGKPVAEAEGDGWLLEDGDVTRDGGDYADDLATLMDRVRSGTGNMYSRHIGTLVGGRGARSGVRIDGVTASARIDRQNPPPNAYNVAFQVGNDTYGAVIFTDADALITVLAHLLTAYQNGQIAISPSAQVARAARDQARARGGAKKSK